MLPLKLETSKIMSGEHLKDTICNSLSQQLSEFELLSSMYPNNDEIVLTDATVLKSIQNFLDNKSDYTPLHLDYCVNLFINGIKFEVSVNLPTLYPTEEPDVYVRSNQLNRYQETKLNLELTNVIKSSFLGEVCIHSIICWLQENIHNIVELAHNNSAATDENVEDIPAIEGKFYRWWIYSHHIYNKKKRDEIVKQAKELKLTGFSLPGKPGIVCIEGPSSNCIEWWKVIKSMNWKKIVLRKTEEFELAEQIKTQKFFNFEEMHSNMSEFSKFMEKHGLSQVFNDVFGFGGDL